MDTQKSLSLKLLRNFVRKLRLRDGDVVLIRSESPLSRIDALNTLDDAVRSANIHDVIFIVVDDFDAVETIDEAKMMELGWVRTKRIDKLLGVNKVVQQDDSNKEA